MLSMLSAVIAAAAVAASAPEPAAAPQGQAAAQTASAKPAKPKLICRTELPTGSRLGGTKICKTQAEWDEIARNSRDTLDNSIRRGLSVTCPRGATC